MSPTVARATTSRGFAATIAAALIAALGLTVASAPSASAVSGDGYVSFTWISAVLTTDGGTIGAPDPGDVVTLTFEIEVSADAPADVDWLYLYGGEYDAYYGSLSLAPGTSRTFTATADYLRLVIDPLGGGPHLVPGRLDLRLSNGLLDDFLVPAPPVIYPTPSPITVSTSFDMTEDAGSVPGQLVDGDSVHYVTHVTNTSSVPVRLSGTGYASPTLPMWLAAGASVDLLGATVDVTYGHMAAGGVSFADTSVGWWVD